MRALERLSATAVLAAAYAVAGVTAYKISRPEETIVAAVCFLALIAYWRSRGEARVFWAVVFPLPAFVLFHEQFGAKHWVAVAPAAVSLAMAWRADRGGG